MNKRVIDKEESKAQESTRIVAGEVQEEGRNACERKGHINRMRHATFPSSHKMRHFVFSKIEDKNRYSTSNFPQVQELKQLIIK